MDLTELEFMDDDLEPRELSSRVLELREAMVNSSKSYITGLPMKRFYDGSYFGICASDVLNCRQKLLLMI